MAAPRRCLKLNPQAPEYFPLSHQTPLLIYPPTPSVNLNYYSIPFHPQPSVYSTTTDHLQTLPTPPPPTAATPPPTSTLFRRSPVRRWSGGGACSRRSNGFRRNNIEERENNDNNNRKKFGGNGNKNINGFSRVVGYRAVRRSAKRPVVPLKYGEGNVTTVMIKNIPNKLTRWGLLMLLDKHCMLANQASKESGNVNTVSAYDFIYLPMDFKTGVNKGYAFVNFINTKAVWEFYNEFHHKKWDDFASPKIGEIVCAMIQGKEELMRHFGSTLFMCGSDVYLPLCFSPARDGSGQPVAVLTVGKRNSAYLTSEEIYKREKSPKSSYIT